MITNATPGTAKLTFANPFAIPAGKTGFFTTSVTVATNAPLNATSQQSLRAIAAIGGGNTVTISNLPATLGTVRVVVPVPTRTATPTPTPIACGALTVTAKAAASGAAGATVQSGGFKVVNGCGQPIAISSLLIGATDVNVVSTIKVAGRVGSPPSPPSVAFNQDEMIVNASPGSARITFTNPLQVPKGQTAFFLVAAVLTTNAPAGAPSTQSVKEVAAIRAGKPVGATNLPATLGTVSRK